MWIITILAAAMVMLAYFLLLYGAVGFIQDKRFFASAPKENLAVIPDRKERFRGAHALGWGIEGLAAALFIGAAVLCVWDGVQRDFGFLLFLRGFLRCFMPWRSMTLFSLIGCCCAAPTSFPTFTRS